MKWKEWLEKWRMTSLKISPPFMELEWQPKDKDKDAAWEMYIELLTRITTQSLAEKDGDEKTALASIFSIFGTTRQIIKTHGRSCSEFTKIAIIILNQKIRPFTAKWHKVSLENGFDGHGKEKVCRKFRKDLTGLQKILIIYTQMLGEMAGVEEDLIRLESNNVKIK